MPNGEIATSAIVHDAFQSGKRVFVPYIHDAATQSPGQPKAVMDMLSLTSEDDYNSLKPDNWGIPTLGKESVTSRENCLGGKGPNGEQTEDSTDDEKGLDLVVMPGMAFDRSMARLGHGKGFYDYFLHRFNERTRAMRTRMPFLGTMNWHCARCSRAELTQRVEQSVSPSRSNCSLRISLSL